MIDLVMVLSSIARLTGDKRELLAREEKQVSGRLWQLESSISGKPEAVLAELVKEKKIKPPVHLAQRLQQYLQEQERMKLTRPRRDNR